MLALNNIKKIIILSIVVLLIFSSNAIGIVRPTSKFYVNDYAGVLSTETEEYIVQTNIDLEQKTGAQIVVVTIDSLEGQTIEEYATQLFRNFGIGNKSKNNGVLLLCSTVDRMFRIEVGYGLEGRLTDGKTGRIQDEYIIPYLKNNNYDEGIKNGFSAVLQEVATEYGVIISGAQEVSNSTTDELLINKMMTISVTSMIITFIMEITMKMIKIKKGKIWIRLIYLCFLGIVAYSFVQVLSIFIVTFNVFMMLKMSIRGTRSILWTVEVSQVEEDFPEEDFLVEEDLLEEEEAQEVFKIRLHFKKYFEV